MSLGDRIASVITLIHTKTYFQSFCEVIFFSIDLDVEIIVSHQTLLLIALVFPCLENPKSCIKFSGIHQIEMVKNALANNIFNSTRGIISFHCEG